MYGLKGVLKTVTKQFKMLKIFAVFSLSFLFQVVLIHNAETHSGGTNNAIVTTIINWKLTTVINHYLAQTLNSITRNLHYNNRTGT